MLPPRDHDHHGSTLVIISCRSVEHCCANKYRLLALNLRPKNTNSSTGREEDLNPAVSRYLQNVSRIEILDINLVCPYVISTYEIGSAVVLLRKKYHAENTMQQ